jgi:hypothetical protein
VLICLKPTSTHKTWYKQMLYLKRSPLLGANSHVSAVYYCEIRKSYSIFMPYVSLETHYHACTIPQAKALGYEDL